MGHIAALTLSHITTHSITAAEQQYCISVVVVWCLVMAQLAACGAASPLCRGSAAVSSDWDTTGLHQPEPGHIAQCAGLGQAIARLHVHMATGHRAPGTPTSLNMADNPTCSEEVPLMRHNVSGSRNYAWFCQLSLFRLQSNKNTRG